MSDTMQAKLMLKGKFNLLQKKDFDLFRKEFKEQIADTVKTQKKSKELFSRRLFLESNHNGPFIAVSRRLNFMGGIPLTFEENRIFKITTTTSITRIEEENS